MSNHEQALQDDIAARLVQLGFGVQQEVRYQQHDTCNPHKSWRQHRCDLYVIAPTTWAHWMLWSPFVIECKVGSRFGGSTKHLRTAQKQCRIAMRGLNFRTSDGTPLHRPRMALIASHDTWFDDERSTPRWGHQPRDFGNDDPPAGWRTPAPAMNWLHAVDVLHRRRSPFFQQGAHHLNGCVKTYYLVPR